MENRIKEVAYSIWENEGCPDGKNSEHWAMAEVIVKKEIAKKPKKKTVAKKKAPVKKKVSAKKKAVVKKVKTTAKKIKAIKKA